MNLTIVLLFLTAIVNFALGFFVFLKNRKNIINRLFFSLTIFVAGWTISIGLLNLTTAHLWTKSAFVFTSFLTGNILLFSIYFPRKLTFIGHRIGWFLFFVAVFFAVISMTSLIVVDTSLIDVGIYIELGMAYPLFIIFFVLYFLGATIIFIRRMIKAHGYEHQQILYFIVGYFISAFFASMTNLIIPYVFGRSDFNRFGPIFTMIFVAFTAYAIVRYRLMDIRVIIKRSTVFAVLVAVMTGLYTLLAVVLADVLRLSIPMTGFVVAVVVALGFDPLKRWLSATTDSFLFKGEYKPETLLEELGSRASSTLNMQKIFSSILELFDIAFHPSKQAILVAAEKDKSFGLGEAKGFYKADDIAVSLKKSHPLINFFKKHQEPVVSEEYERQYGDGIYLHKGMKNFLKKMAKKDIAMYVPFHSKEKLIGLLMLGNKKSGDVYTDQDIQVLDIASSQLAVSIENARLFEEMKDFNLALQKEVKKATAALQRANQELKQLDRAKSEFISIASHQLRTPMTIVKGYISMMLEGSFGKIPPEEIEPLKKVYDSNSRLIQLIESLLNISRIESGKLKYDFIKMDLAELVNSVMDELRPNAESKGLEFIWNKPSMPLPKVTVDSEKIRQVILNLIDNSMKYTPKGKVEVNLVKEKGSIVFSVTDTGLGMTKDEMVDLFKKFSRGDRKKRLEFTGGSGLGLYVGRMMVEVHGGKIWAESKGRNKGSTFAFNLPLKPGKLPKLPRESRLVK